MRVSTENVSSVPRKRMKRTHIQIAAQDWIVQKYDDDRESGFTLNTLIMIKVGVIRLSHLVKYLKYFHLA